MHVQREKLGDFLEKENSFQFKGKNPNNSALAVNVL